MKTSDNKSLLLLLKYFGYSMKDINFEWDKLTETEREIFTSKENFEEIKTLYDILYKK
jgi:hypothetical protein